MAEWVRVWDGDLLLLVCPANAWVPAGRWNPRWRVELV